MKRLVSLSVVVLLLFGTVVWGEGTTEAAEEVIRIGFYGPLSGPSSMFGTESQKGAELAIKQINAAGGVLGKQLVLVPYDDKSSPEQAVKAVTRMIEADKVHAIVGSLHSGNVQAQGAVNEAAKMPQVGIGTSPVWLEQGWKYLFRPLPNTRIPVVEIAKTIKNLGYKRVGVIARLDEWGKSNEKILSAELQRLGIVYTTEWFQPGDTDFTTQLVKLNNWGMDAIVAFYITNDASPGVKQIRNAGYKGLIFGSEPLADPALIEVAGKDADGCVFGSAFLIPKTPEEGSTKKLRDYFTAFHKEHGRMPTSDCSMRAYDAVNLLAIAFKNAKTLEGPTVRDALENIHGVEGLAGVFDFRGHNGEGIHSANMFAIQGGKYVLLEDFLKTYKK